MNKLSKEEYQQKEYYNSIAKTYDLHYANKDALKYRFSVYNSLLGNLDLQGKRF